MSIEAPSHERRALHQWVGLALGPIAFVSIAFVPSGLSELPGYGDRPAWAAATVALMAIWWLTEAVPIALTACLPLVAYPLTDVYGKGFVGGIGPTIEPYFDGYIFLFLGGMAIGAAMEEHALHRRIALHVMLRVGSRPERLLLGVLLATALISMWISNTATAVMMLPIALAVQRQVELDAGNRRLGALGAAMMLAVAYGANIGGIGTKIGTGTNSIFAGFVSEKLGRDLGFLEFSAVAVPFVAVFVPIAWRVLWRHARRDAPAETRGDAPLRAELEHLGPLRAGERRVAFVFAVAATLWISGDLLRPALAPLAPGGKLAGKHYEAGVAMLAAATLIALRSVSWRSLRGLPWGTLVLLGGSFAMASGIDGSGLSKILSRALGGVGDLPEPVQIAVATGASVALSAVASNTATINVLLNMLPPRLPALYGATFGASCDFALPAGTPPNAIVFGSGYLRLPTMMRIGVVLDALAVVVITAWLSLVARFL